jgi:hypothetical protein
MVVLERWVNRLFVRRLVVFAVAMATLKCVLALSPIGSPSWVFFLSAFLVGLFLLQKRSVSAVYPPGGSNIKVFLRAAIIYFVPVSALWTILNMEFFLKYLPLVGLHLPPEWPLFSTVSGTLALGKILLQSELARLQPPAA